MHPFIAEQLVSQRRAQALADTDHSRVVRAAAADPTLGARRQRLPGWRHCLGVGALALVTAFATFVSSPAESGPDSSTSLLGAEPVTLVGLTPNAVEHVSYDPGMSRSWSPGRQIVAVKVLSGHLTISRANGERRVYVAGKGYAAGWAAYRAVNETDAPVETLVIRHVQA